MSGIYTIRFIEGTSFEFEFYAQIHLIVDTLVLTRMSDTSPTSHDNPIPRREGSPPPSYDTLEEAPCSYELAVRPAKETSTGSATMPGSSSQRRPRPLVPCCSNRICLIILIAVPLIITGIAAGIVASQITKPEILSSVTSPTSSPTNATGAGVQMPRG